MNKFAARVREYERKCFKSFTLPRLQELLKQSGSSRFENWRNRHLPNIILALKRPLRPVACVREEHDQAAFKRAQKARIRKGRSGSFAKASVW